MCAYIIVCMRICRVFTFVYLSTDDKWKMCAHTNNVLVCVLMCFGVRVCVFALYGMIRARCMHESAEELRCSLYANGEDKQKTEICVCTCIFPFTRARVAKYVNQECTPPTNTKPKPRDNNN